MTRMDGCGSMDQPPISKKIGTLVIQKKDIMKDKFLVMILKMNNKSILIRVVIYLLTRYVSLRVRVGIAESANRKRLKGVSLGNSVCTTSYATKVPASIFHVRTTTTRYAMQRVIITNQVNGLMYSRDFAKQNFA